MVACHITLECQLLVIVLLEKKLGVDPFSMDSPKCIMYTFYIAYNLEVFFDIKTPIFFNPCHVHKQKLNEKIDA
jgi:hypothetical protein